MSLFNSAVRGTGLILALALSWGGTGIAAEVVIYDNAFENGFVGDYSYGDGYNFADTAQSHSAPDSISFVGAEFHAVSFTHPTMSFDTAVNPVLHFWIRGASPGAQSFTLQIYADRNGSVTAQSALDNFITGGSISAAEWREVTVPLTQPPLSLTGSIERIDVQNNGSTQTAVYFDDISLQPAVVDPIFKNGFDGDTTPPAGNGLVEDHDVTVLNMLSDRFTWTDADGQTRVAVLAHNDAASAGPGGTRGGELRQFQYHTAAGTRTVKASGNNASGFGYIVSHSANDGGNCTNAKIDNAYSDPYDTSLLGHLRGGTFTRIFEGRHHAIFRFTTTYPRYCAAAGNTPGYLAPVTIDWVFSTGRNNPLWSITWDLSGVAVNVLEDDSRAPYGELLFDGSATEGDHSVIAGVGWGDGYKFTTTSSPVTLQSSWTWNQANTIPYSKLWTTAVDATMGIVQTLPIAQQDAGGYFGSDRWNTTSAAGDACAAGNEYHNSPAHPMPCSTDWDYQTINYSIGVANGGSDTGPTNNTRFAWGTEFGFLGQSGYHINGSTWWGGPLTDTLASGWPKKSYSVFVVLGTHSNDPVDAQVAQMEATQSVSLTASVGSVPSTGPAGINRSDTQNYSTAGYDPVYSALTFVAAGNAIDATIGVGGGKTLSNPMIVIRNYTSANYPKTVALGGTTLVMDVDYFPSLRASNSELWITLNKDITGANNRLQITP